MIYANVPEDDFDVLESDDLKATTFLPSVVTVMVTRDQKLKALATLLGWQGEDGAHVFLSPDGFACYLKDWVVSDVVR